ncbi:MAG TPA: avidin/streptavidin family protein [Chloroflexia bacterium]|jgi:hypothetical protein
MVNPLLGVWHNELGSTLFIDEVQGGLLSGRYQTAVSSSGCAHGIFQVVGVTDTESDGHNVGFTVSWNNASSKCSSVTSWSGQLLTDANNNPYITAFWLLTMESKQADSWWATHVGQDTFFPMPPSEAAIAGKSNTGRRSHP